MMIQTIPQTMIVLLFILFFNIAISGQDVAIMKNKDFSVKYRVISSRDLDKIIDIQEFSKNTGKLSKYYVFGKITRNATAKGSAYIFLEFRYSKIIFLSKNKTVKSEIGWIDSGDQNGQFFLIPFIYLMKDLPDDFDIKNLTCNISITMVK